MPNVKHPDFASLDRPENEIGISANRHAAAHLSSQGLTDFGVLTDRVDCPSDGELHAESPSRAALFKVVQNICQAVLRTPRIADDRRPWRCHSAPMSASGANSPLLAWSRPCLIAARVSLSRESGPSRISIDQSSISAVSS